MAIVELPTLNQSRSQAMRNKTWIKRLARVDAGERGGYAFIGEFEKFGATVEAEPGTWFLSFAEDRRAAGRLDGIEVRLYRVAGAGDLEQVEAWNLDGAPGWALKVRDQVAAHLAGPAAEQAPAAPVSSLLLAELADWIDEQLDANEGRIDRQYIAQSAAWKVRRLAGVKDGRGDVLPVDGEAWPALHRALVEAEARTWRVDVR